MLGIVNCRFSGNEAGDAGGVMVLGPGSSVTLVQCVFNQNYARNNGGVIAAKNTQLLAIYNCTFSGNIAQRNAGGIFIEVDKRIPREQVVPFQSRFLLCNSIFWDNEDSPDNGQQPPSMFVRGEQVGIEILACCMQGWDETIPGADVIDQDPLFLDPNGDNETPDDDFMLKSGSPCIDAGIAFDVTDINSDENINEMIPRDMKGDPRINNGRIDLGPYEY